MAASNIEALKLATNVITQATPVMRAAIRRVWLQGRPVYERLDGRTFAWWPDGRLVATDGSGEAYLDPAVLGEPLHRAQTAP